MSNPLADRVAGRSTTIFAEINQLAAAHNAINLGQGAPDFNPAPFIIEAVQRAAPQMVHQYAPGLGYPAMRAAIAAHAARFYGMDLNPATDVMVTTGATEAIYAALLGIVNPGDEVILFEPFYDSYVPNIELAGGIPRYIPLHAPDWHFDAAELEGLFSPKTRAILINTPHNPTGKIYTHAELSLIADLCQRYDVIAITDEVYEHILFDGAEHLRLATLPGMRNRTITISSLGKTFSTTGWKIGWAMGSEALITAVFRACQFVTFSVASVLQHAAADILQNAPDSFFSDLQQMYQRKRDYLYDALCQTPLRPLQPQGSYFVMADTSALGLPDDRAVTEFLIQRAGVATIPPASFYSPPHQPFAHTLTRFSICKTDETLQAAAARLQTLTTKEKPHEL